LYSFVVFFLCFYLVSRKLSEKPGTLEQYPKITKKAQQLQALNIVPGLQNFTEQYETKRHTTHSKANTT
jgi:hypothetical protein